MNKTRLLFPLLLAVSVSCASKENAENATTNSIEFSYKVDTVMVDAGDQFIYLNSNLFNSEVSPDGKYLYNFKRGSGLGVEVIDLENLKLEKVIPMELDGPNSIRSEYISKIYILPDGTFYLSDNYEVYHFDQDGNKFSTLTYANHDYQGKNLPEDMRIALKETLSKDGNTLLTLYGDQKLEESEHGIAVFELKNKQFSYKPLEIFKELDKYRANFYFDGNHTGSTYAGIHLQFLNDSLIYSNTAKNEAHFYKLSTDSLSTKVFKSKYTSQEAPGNYQNRGESDKEIDEIVLAKSKEVNYGRLFFDNQNDVYWRFAKEVDRMKGDTVMYKTVLTAFDSQFNQLHEELLPSDFILPYKYFAREGMIYTYLNIDDELAFVRIKPTISYE